MGRDHQILKCGHIAYKKKHIMEIYIPPELQFIEQELHVFIDAMLYKLEKNKHKGKWENQSLISLVSRLEGEMDELAKAIDDHSTTDILMEAADIANYAMMIADIAIKGQGPFATRAKIGSNLMFMQWLLTIDIEYCIPWPFRSRTGPNLEYGALPQGLSEYGRRAHRVLCVWAHGEPPTLKHEACHTCGVSLCMNPKHLMWGTHQENEADKKEHGTYINGEQSTGGELIQTQVDEIRTKRKKGIYCQILAEEYDVSLTTISLIINNHTWKEIHNARIKTKA